MYLHKQRRPKYRCPSPDEPLDDAALLELLVGPPRLPPDLPSSSSHDSPTASESAYSSTASVDEEEHLEIEPGVTVVGVSTLVPTVLVKKAPVPDSRQQADKAEEHSNVPQQQFHNRPNAHWPSSLSLTQPRRSGLPPTSTPPIAQTSPVLLSPTPPPFVYEPPEESLRAAIRKKWLNAPATPSPLRQETPPWEYHAAPAPDRALRASFLEMWQRGFVEMRGAEAEMGSGSENESSDEPTVSWRARKRSRFRG